MRVRDEAAWRVRGEQAAVLKDGRKRDPPARPGDSRALRGCSTPSRPSRVTLLMRPGEITARECAAASRRGERETSLFLVAWLGDRMSATWAWWPSATRVPARARPRMSVARDCRGLVGRALLERALAWARENGALKIELSVFAHNEPALGFYKRHGFAREGLRRRQLVRAGEYHDEVLMARSSTGVLKWPTSPVPSSRRSSLQPAWPFSRRGGHRLATAGSRFHFTAWNEQPGPDPTRSSPGWRWRSSTWLVRSSSSAHRGLRPARVQVRTVQHAPRPCTRTAAATEAGMRYLRAREAPPAGAPRRARNAAPLRRRCSPFRRVRPGPPSDPRKAMIVPRIAARASTRCRQRPTSWRSSPLHTAQEVGANFMGCCPFHEEKTASFSSIQWRSCTTASAAARRQPVQLRAAQGEPRLRPVREYLATSTASPSSTRRRAPRARPSASAATVSGRCSSARPRTTSAGCGRGAPAPALGLPRAARPRRRGLPAVPRRLRGPDGTACATAPSAGVHRAGAARRRARRAGAPRRHLRPLRERIVFPLADDRGRTLGFGAARSATRSPST